MEEGEGKRELRWKRGKGVIIQREGEGEKGEGEKGKGKVEEGEGRVELEEGGRWGGR